MAKRVNKRFLAMLLAIVIGAAGLLAVAMKVLVPKSPRQHINLGQMMYNEGRFNEAVSAYNAAVALSPNDADLRVKLGDCLIQLSSVEPEFYGRAFAAWSRALEI